MIMQFDLTSSMVENQRRGYHNCTLRENFSELITETTCYLKNKVVRENK